MWDKAQLRINATFNLKWTKLTEKDSLFSVVKSGTGVFDYSSDDTSDKYVLSTDVLYCSAPKSSKITADA